MTISASNNFISGSSVYSQKKFFCCRSKRLKLNTSDGKIYDIAMRSDNGQRRLGFFERMYWFRANINGQWVLLNKNSFHKHTSFQANWACKILNKTAGMDLEIVMRTKRDMTHLQKYRAEVGSNKKVFKICAYLERNRSILAGQMGNQDVMKGQFKKGRPFIAHLNPSTKQIDFFVDVSWKGAQPSTLLGKGAFKSFYQYAGLQGPSTNKAFGVRKVSDIDDAVRGIREFQIMDSLRDIPQVAEVDFIWKENVTDLGQIQITQPNAQMGLMMERYPGTLRSLFYGQIAGLTLTRKQKLHIFVEVVKGISKIHERGIIHRDLKLGNILFCVSYKNGIPNISVKIADFDLACYSDDNEIHSHRAGTSYYMAPENIGHELKTDPYKMDTWSLAIVLFKVIFEQQIPFAEVIAKSFDDDNMRGKVRKELLLKEVNNLRDRLERIDNPWIDLLLRGLEPDVTKRISSRKFAKKFEALLAANLEPPLALQFV